jgi:outer membrane protein assembly factor BamA
MQARAKVSQSWAPARWFLLLLLGLMCLPVRSMAQEALAASSSSRAQTIEQEERAKLAHLEENRPPRGQQLFDRIEERVIDPTFIPNGFSIKLGGLPSGGGFSLGPRYTRTDLFRERVTTDTSVVGSTKLWWRGETWFTAPALAGNHLALRLGAAYENAASMRYFGEGPTSSTRNETNFRREFTTPGFEARIHDVRNRITVGYRIGGLLANIGPGRLSSPPSTDTIFTEANTPGLDRQSNYVTGTAFAGLDLTQQGYNDPRGWTFDVANTQFWDRTWDAYSFDLLRTQAVYRFTYANGMRTLAFRARNETAFPNGGDQVPFYLQPTLGGPNDLRGYQRYRFYGSGGSSLLTAEYRWTLGQAIEMALFADGGNVYERPGLIGFRHNRGDGGIGVRFKNKEATFMRLDLGVSPEGVQVWFVFNPVFGRLARSF